MQLWNFIHLSISNQLSIYKCSHPSTFIYFYIYPVFNLYIFSSAFYPFMKVHILIIVYFYPALNLYIQLFSSFAVSLCVPLFRSLFLRIRNASPGIPPLMCFIRKHEIWVAEPVWLPGRLHHTPPHLTYQSHTTGRRQSSPSTPTSWVPKDANEWLPEEGYKGVDEKDREQGRKWRKAGKKVREREKWGCYWTKQEWKDTKDVIKDGRIYSLVLCRFSLVTYPGSYFLAALHGRLSYPTLHNTAQ